VRTTTTARRDVVRVESAEGDVRRRTRRDLLATEEPLEIRAVPAVPGEAGPAGTAHPVAVTMRTPGADFELAAGFLFAESLIDHAAQVAAIRYCPSAAGGAEQRYNVVNVHLAPDAPFDVARLQRNFYVSSSCGVCGKASIEAVQALACASVRGDLRLDASVLLALPERLRARQSVFDRTGGLHAAAAFTAEGELLRVREDVGRHNALDKLVGACLLAGELPLTDRLVLVSGRLSFELVQKAARAGATVLAGFSAPSSLAAELAESVGMTLVGFLRDSRFNLYAGAERLAG
jgi:FdhD protein